MIPASPTTPEPSSNRLERSGVKPSPTSRGGVVDVAEAPMTGNLSIGGQSTGFVYQITPLARLSRTPGSTGQDQNSFHLALDP